MADRLPNSEVLLERDYVVLTTYACLNTTRFLWKVRENQEASEHKGLDIIEYQIKVRPDEAKLFVDGLSWVIEEKRQNGYAIINGTKHFLCEGGRLPNSWSA